MTAPIGLYGRSGRSMWRPTNPHACVPFRRRACLDDQTCAPLVPGPSPERPQSCPVSRPSGTKIDGGQPKSEAQPLAVPITADRYHRLLKIGTVTGGRTCVRSPRGRLWRRVDCTVHTRRRRCSRSPASATSPTPRSDTASSGRSDPPPRYWPPARRTSASSSRRCSCTRWSSVRNSDRR